jgi:hypothetical protein
MCGHKVWASNIKTTKSGYKTRLRKKRGADQTQDVGGNNNTECRHGAWLDKKGERQDTRCVATTKVERPDSRADGNNQARDSAAGLTEKKSREGRQRGCLVWRAAPEGRLTARDWYTLHSDYDSLICEVYHCTTSVRSRKV